MAAVTAALGGGGGTGPALGGAPGGGAGSDTTAIHDNVASEISAITNKATPVGGDLVLIEDSADSNSKKYSTLTNVFDALGGGGSFQLALLEKSSPVTVIGDLAKANLSSGISATRTFYLPAGHQIDSVTVVGYQAGAGGVVSVDVHLDFGIDGSDWTSPSSASGTVALGTLAINERADGDATSIFSTVAAGSLIGVRTLGKTPNTWVDCGVFIMVSPV